MVLSILPQSAPKNNTGHIFFSKYVSGARHEITRKQGEASGLFQKKKGGMKRK